MKHSECYMNMELRWYNILSARLGGNAKYHGHDLLPINLTYLPDLSFNGQCENNEAYTPGSFPVWYNFPSYSPFVQRIF